MGEKETLAWHDAATARVAGVADAKQSVVYEKSPASAPEMWIPVTVIGTLPVFVNVMLRLAPPAPTRRAPKPELVGATSARSVGVGGSPSVVRAVSVLVAGTSSVSFDSAMPVSMSALPSSGDSIALLTLPLHTVAPVAASKR